MFDELPATTGSASGEPFERTPSALARYRRAIERSDIPIVVTSVATDDFGEILECNTAFVRLLAGERDALIGASWMEFTPPEDREMVRRAVERLVDEGQEIDQVERCFERTDGGAVWTSASVALLRDREHQPVAAVCKLADISARKAYEAERGASSDYHAACVAFQAAIDADEFDLMYEPVLDLDSGQIVALDAVGPCHPDYRELSPVRIVDVADDLNLGIELGLWMLTRACSRLAKLEAIPSPPRMIVRVPAQLLADPRLAERALSSISECRINAAKITLEIEEHSLTHAPAHVERELRALSREGLSIYVGHFGHGVSSLARLRSIPVDGLKVAEELVGRMGEASDARLVAALITIGLATEVEVIAEGISSAAHLYALQELGCTLGKGPFLAGYVRGDDLVDVLAAVPSPLRVAPESDEPPPVNVEFGPTLALGAAADALRISPSTLRRWADHDRIRSIRTVGGHRRFPVSEVRRHLQREARGPRPELLREPAIKSPKPILADLLSNHGFGLVERAPREMYADTQGWFARPEASADLRQWVVGVTDAARTGDQSVLTAACAHLSERAAANGALLIETLRFIALFFQTVEFALSRMQVAPEILIDLRSVSGAARQSVLYHVDAHR